MSHSEKSLSVSCEFRALDKYMVDSDYTIVAEGANWRRAGFHDMSVR